MAPRTSCRSALQWIAIVSLSLYAMFAAASCPSTQTWERRSGFRGLAHHPGEEDTPREGTLLPYNGGRGALLSVAPPP